ncbi:hypothetical protein DN756_12865 [Yersinia pseudotuberculosis]|nr:DUF6708 domain-containing protein [Yersinia pseudotuberculosis]AYW88512.1 hypothetical protein EGX87_15745 [Yersinia pseudotuberculosis]AYW99261.1 hypothetical protein EGX53_04890 [Yersinia pseudotuberculosis]AZA30823.1 hypothetical protein DN756_12865 [Yersinia pseudotuberculosis]MBK1424382.1 hypothetical protein [Yersinia pseudotuberculosis]
MNKKNSQPPRESMQEMRAGYLKERDPSISRLIPQVKYWEEDLPEQDEEQPTAPRLIRVNKINDTWMEIPRYENIMWSGMWIIGFGCFIPITIAIFFLQLPGLIFEVSMKLLYSFFIFLAFSMLTFFFRMALFVPRGTPVRFNRKRQKVYVYEHQRSNWNPWSRWPTVIKVFDWADIHGEMVRQVGRYDSGHRLSCAVCKPGTYEVVDRFILSWTEGDSRVIRGLWSHCCQYMQGKTVPETPLLTRKPWSWCPINTIHWPEDIERGSTTAPDA